MKIHGSLRPRKMKELKFTVLDRDIDAVIEFLGRRSIVHFTDDDGDTSRVPDEAVFRHIQGNLEKLERAAVWMEVQLPSEPLESSCFPGEVEERLLDTITATVFSLGRRENETFEEQRKVEEALNEARAFANLDAPFSDLDQLSYLTLRIGRLDKRQQEELRHNLRDRTVIIPLGSGDRFLAAASRKGRFALDSELKKMGFIPITIPEGYKGIPTELFSGLEERYDHTVERLKEISKKKEELRNEYAAVLQSLAASYHMSAIAEQLKSRLVTTHNAYLLTGWVPQDMIRTMVEELETLTEGRIAVRAYSPEEVRDVKEGRKKVPVCLKHGAFVRGFQRVVFSYGAPLYGTIDPTPIVAFFFTFLFGLMFGDFGQGMVLFILGLLTRPRRKQHAFFSKFGHFSIPLIAVGISSMIMGALSGEFFAHKEILVGPTRAITAFLTGRPMDRILVLMPLHEEGGSIVKLFYFFAFTIAVGFLLNSAGLIINTANQFFLKNYEKAIFSKTGLSGIIFFWYAISIALRFSLSMARSDIFSFNLYWFDAAALIIPILGIFFGPAIWRMISGKSLVFPEGLLVFVIHGFVEILEIVSTYISNTVSFLRVGAFALSHAVLSYIIFRFSEEVASAPAGTILSIIIFVFGNLVIILLEGLIVAIQVVRLQYYEFFSKFFTETGIEFSPFRFRKERSES